MRGGQSSRAAEIFNLGESIFRRILQRQILSKSFSLDAAPSALKVLQTMVLTSAKSFLGVNNHLLADAIIRWKCIFSEFRAILMQLGVGEKYLETFKALQEMKTRKEVSSSNMEDQLIRISDEHHRAVHQVMCVKGMLLLVSLLKQNHEEVRSLLKPGQILLEYCPVQDEYSYSKLSASGPVEKEYNGLLLMLQTGKAPVIKSIDFAEAAACARKWIKAAPNCSKDEALQLTSELCDLLIPAEIQAILSSDHVQQVLLCPDPTFTLVPLDLLLLPSGQKLGDKCTMVYLSAARELLRSSALTAAQEIFSVIEEHRKSIQEDGSISTTAQEPASKPAHNAHPEPVLVPSVKECLIFADPNYDLEQRYPAEGDAGVLETLIGGLSSLFLKPSQQKSLAFPLPKTRDEANEIEYTLSVANKSLFIRCFLGDDATLSSALQVESPFMLHFSTHGFSNASVLGVPGTFWDDTKCGLILAGANTYRRGDLSKVTAVAGTGELTALAVMGMNLHGTHLVYLSACISAQGSVASGESVNSLAQSFRAAGAKTVVATLWSVLDNEARMFAVHFYYEVCKTGVTPSQALLSAKRKMQEAGYHWIFWSGFICIGEDTPLFQDM